MEVPNDMLCTAQKRPQADEKDGDKKHEGPRSQYVVTLLEMLEPFRVVIGV